MAKREMKTKQNEEVLVEKTVVEEAVVEEAAGETIEPVSVKPLVGIISNCTRLNIRKKPNKSADVVTVLNAKTEVTIDPDYTNKEWYKLVSDAGYCMKAFITLK